MTLLPGFRDREINKLPDSLARQSQIKILNSLLMLLN
jgi:hypothetical protein